MTHFCWPALTTRLDTCQAPPLHGHAVSSDPNRSYEEEMVKTQLPSLTMLTLPPLSLRERNASPPPAAAIKKAIVVMVSSTLKTAKWPLLSRFTFRLFDHDPVDVVERHFII
jgi:hypothetical protein